MRIVNEIYLKSKFLEENKDNIICYPSEKTLTHMLNEKKRPIPFLLVKDDFQEKIIKKEVNRENIDFTSYKAVFG